MKYVLILTMAAAIACPAMAALVDSRQDTTAAGAVVDGVLGAGEYGNGAYSYTGGGAGFGGTLGNGVIYMDSDANNLYIGFQPGGDLNDNVAIMIDSRGGGFVDADMDDQADGGRRAVSNQTANADDAYPAGVLPDFGMVIGNFGIVLFELNAGNTPGHLNFVSFDGTFTGNAPTFREFAIPLATLELSASDVVANSCLNFFAAYVSDSSFNSNESIPVSPALNAGPNPGFDGPSAGYANHNEFCIVPEPASLLALGLLGAIIRRR